MKKEKVKKPIYKKVWFWIVIVILVFVIGGAASGNNNSSDKSTDTSSTKDASSSSSSSSSSEKAKDGWTQSIYDSIVSAKTEINSDGTITYTGGTPYADIEAKVGKPDTTSESSVGDMTTILANWTSTSFIKGETQSITITYDKATGQITAKSKVNM